MPDQADEVMDNLLAELTGMKRSDALKLGICVYCHRPIGEFKNALSVKEYSISGLCQECQDDVFETEE